MFSPGYEAVIGCTFCASGFRDLPNLLAPSAAQVTQRGAFLRVGEGTLDGFERGACFAGFGCPASSCIHVPDFVRDASRTSDLPKPARVHIAAHRKALSAYHDSAGALCKRDRLKKRQQESVFGEVEVGGGAVL